MPIAELLGVQLDMQLLLKLSLSVASVLLVSWAYRFYSSRAPRAKACLPPAGDPAPDGGGAPEETREPLKETACGRALAPGCAADGRDPLKGRCLLVYPADDRTSERTGDIERRRRARSESCAGDDGLDRRSAGGDGEVPRKRRDEVPAGNASVDPASPNLRHGGPGGGTGGRSPCFLQRLEHSVGVGRELRQEVDHQGAHSSFLSKAEIKVDEANLVREGTGPDQVVRGKIYDYFIDSQSVSESKPAYGRYERKPVPDPKPGFGRCESLSSPDYNPTFARHERTSSPGSRRVDGGQRAVRGGGSSSSVAGSHVEAGPPLSPIIMRDLVLGRSVQEPLSPVTPPGPGPPAKPALLRKESYLSATEQHSQLPIPCLTPGASAPGSPSQTSPCEEPHSASPGISGSVMNPAAAGPWVEPGLETLARAPFVHLPAKRLNSGDLEGLKSKLDLGNCMEVLGLAKLYGDEPLKAAALRVMSDNYLQVLREPALYGRLMACERETIQRQRTRGRRFVMAADMDPRDWTGPQGEAGEQRRTSSSLYYYDNYKDAWSALCPVPREVISKGCALCTMDNYLFVAVGCQGTEHEMVPSKRVFCFNPATSIWKEISPMNQARPHCKLAAAGGYMYAIGGECLSTVERYDPRADRWAFVASLPGDTFAVGHRAAVCNGEIYVTGGTLRYALLRYSPDRNEWRPGVVVGSGDQTVDMAAVRNFLYRFENNPRLGVSAYRYHAVARLWYLCSNTRLAPVPPFRCVAVEDSVYCVGRRFALRFTADDVSPAFCAEPMSVLTAAKGAVFPFVLCLPDRDPVQTSV